MLNQALTEIQTALDILALAIHPQMTPTDLPTDLTQMTEKVEQTIQILENLEKQINAEKLTPISPVELAKSSVHYYQEPWQKTA